MSCMVIVRIFLSLKIHKVNAQTIFNMMRKNGENIFYDEQQNRMKKEAVTAFHLMADESEFSIHSTYKTQHVVRQ